MCDFQLDQSQGKEPIDIVNKLSLKYQYEYNKLHRKQLQKSLKLQKEIIRAKCHNALWFFRMIVHMALLLLFLASNIIYRGFAVNRILGIVILSIVALTVVADCIFCLLSILRITYFRHIVILTHDTLTVCVLLVGLIITSSTSLIINYCFVLIATAILWSLNTAFLNQHNCSDIADQIKKSLIFIITIIIISVPGLFNANRNVIENSETWCDRDLYSRFAMYSITEEQGEKKATFNGMLLTAKDILGTGNIEVYEIDDALSNESQLINDAIAFVEEDVFNGNNKVGEFYNKSKDWVLKNIHKVDPNQQAVIKVTAVGSGAFRDTTSINTVILPESITLIEAGAFEESSVQIVEVYAPEIHIYDNFEGSYVSMIRLLSSRATRIYVQDASILSDRITFCVPADLVFECRSLNPELADYIIEIKE